ncbi:hypothetical protein GEMRC1_002265 [Eukaryota sp. GEM-RC1]
MLLSILFGVFIIAVLLLAVAIVPSPHDGNNDFTSVQPIKQVPVKLRDSTDEDSDIPSSSKSLPRVRCSIPDCSDDEIPTFHTAPSLRLTASFDDQPGFIDDDSSSSDDDNEPYLPPLCIPSSSPCSPSAKLKSMVPSLDMSSLTRHEDPTDISARRKADKLSNFVNVMSQITDSIFISGEEPAGNNEMLKENNITHVLNLAPQVCDPKSNHFDFLSRYLSINIADSPNEDFIPLILRTSTFIHDAVQSNGRVLVHCHQGVSRSCSAVIAYLMMTKQRSFSDCFQDVREKRPICRPNLGFQLSLDKFFQDFQNSRICCFRGCERSQEDPMFVLTVSELNQIDWERESVVLVHNKDNMRLYLWYPSEIDPENLNFLNNTVSFFQKFLSVVSVSTELHGNESRDFQQLVNFPSKKSTEVFDSCPSPSLNVKPEIPRFFALVEGKFNELKVFDDQDLDSNVVAILTVPKNSFDLDMDFFVYIGSSRVVNAEEVANNFAQFFELGNNFKFDIVMEDDEPESFFEVLDSV